MQHSVTELDLQTISSLIWIKRETKLLLKDWPVYLLAFGNYRFCVIWDGIFPEIETKTPKPCDDHCPWPSLMKIFVWKYINLVPSSVELEGTKFKYFRMKIS